MNSSLIIEIDRTTLPLLEAISVFEQKDFNRTPFNGAWSAAQVAEHLVKVESGVSALLSGRTAEVSRDPEAFVPLIRKIFLDFDQKYKSPEEMLPSGKIQHRDKLYQSILSNRERITDLVSAADLNRICELYPFPGAGYYTGKEWICFLNCHSVRHIRQLNNIRGILMEK